MQRRTYVASVTVSFFIFLSFSACVKKYYSSKKRAKPQIHRIIFQTIGSNAKNLYLVNEQILALAAKQPISIEQLPELPILQSLNINLHSIRDNFILYPELTSGCYPVNLVSNIPYLLIGNYKQHSQGPDYIAEQISQKMGIDLIFSGELCVDKTRTITRMRSMSELTSPVKAMFNLIKTLSFYFGIDIGIEEKAPQLSLARLDDLFAPFFSKIKGKTFVVDREVLIPINAIRGSYLKREVSNADFSRRFNSTRSSLSVSYRSINNEIENAEYTIRSFRTWKEKTIQEKLYKENKHYRYAVDGVIKKLENMEKHKKIEFVQIAFKRRGQKGYIGPITTIRLEPI